MTAYFAIEVMVAWGLSEKEARDYWQEGEANLKAEHPAWPNNASPITREHVRERLRWWQKNRHPDESADETKQRVFAISGVFGLESEWLRAEAASSEVFRSVSLR